MLKIRNVGARTRLAKSIRAYSDVERSRYRAENMICILVRVQTCWGPGLTLKAAG
jgi:hypothetical protein